MIDRNRNGDELKEEFSVLGSTGNVRRFISREINHLTFCCRFTPLRLTTSPVATVRLINFN